MWTDSHCHLNLIDLSPYEGDVTRLVQRAADQGVMHLLCAGVDLKTTPNVMGLARCFENVYASVGIHPNDVHCDPFNETQLMGFAKDEKVVGIGETGLDYHYDDVELELQKDVFKKHIELAKKIKKPLVIHSRDAKEDTIKILKENNAQEVRGVMHCFAGDHEMANQAIEMDFYIGVSGIVTFSNAKTLQEVVSRLPLERILVETDAPWLSPVPYRGKPNTPEYIPLIGEKIAEIKGISMEEVAEQTTENFFQLFFQGKKKS
ncbi:MAG: hypothetical protein A2298_05495 [Gammaproteobacteria bacterium RIFOXYB2_FULL_38_6]|nr:MAG: hypothetical protein A2298_05495 [Gammaproteobacteria bacterium RIFOXYB2_FULL_38_6]